MGSKSGPTGDQKVVQKMTPKITKNVPILGPEMGSKIGSKFGFFGRIWLLGSLGGSWSSPGRSGVDFEASERRFGSLRESISIERSADFGLSERS